ncbi:hypothetical protein MMC18_002590 [Xylographa bjoerkii]|nr:hypothetical protein [Xylographa bjoerkii]
MAPTSGLLYVTMAPHASLPTPQFDDWWDNEHAPLRLRLPFFANGFRYRAADLEGSGKGLPEWLAIYDVTDTAELVKEPYMTLRTDRVKTQREKDTMKQITVGRGIYDLVTSQQAPSFKRLEEVTPEPEENVLVVLRLNVHPDRREELESWYTDEHIPLLSKIPGWRRTRLFQTSAVESAPEIEYLAIHDYSPANGLGGPEWKASVSTPWYDSIMSSAVTHVVRRTYNLHYIFSPAPRDLAPLSSTSAIPLTSLDTLTTTHPASSSPTPSITSYITTPDGARLSYTLTGSPHPHAPLLLLSNSILVDSSIWSSFLTTFLSNPAHHKYRILRYHTRGRTSHVGSAHPITISVLAADITHLLDALRVPRAAALIGVSLGGATVLNTALRDPARVAAFVACDTNAVAPASNRGSWGERIAVAEREAAVSATGEAVVGEQLAEMTAKRWFAPQNHGGAAYERVKGLVAGNSLEGFRRGVAALYEYDMREEMRGCRVRGLLVVGGEDGVLPQTMAEMAKGLAGGAGLRVVPAAGHLPMVEEPGEFARVVGEFLARGGVRYGEGLVASS